MKKAISILLSLLFICAFAVPVMAADEAVVFTSNSSFVVGGTVKVDELKTQQNIMDLGKDAAEYNAALEGNMQYYWFRNDTYYKDGTSITLTENDKGCQFYCKVYLFNDADRTQQCGVYDSAKFTLPGAENNATIPTITNKELPNGKVGEAYYQKLNCTDPDVSYSLLRTSLPDGLYLTQHGEIEGTPTKAGDWHVVIMATPEAGEDYAATKEFDIKITEASTIDKPTEPDESSKPTDTTDGSETPTDGTEGTDPTTDTTGANGNQNGKGIPWWGILLIAVVAAGAGVGITIFVLKKKKA